jgi:uncharacterized protein (TIGR04222 family)
MAHATDDPTGHWPQTARDLWRRIEAHDLDVADATLPFSRRLARDHHWSQPYADRVLQEYRRFCFLACVCETPVTPSDQVDQVWHLHLLYTQDYWGPFTEKVLRRPLHHGPTRGGPAEGRRYDDQYTHTRHAYLRWFGEHPPPDIWPSATERFSRDVRWLRVNRDDHWLLPKPGRTGTAAVLRGLALLLGFVVLALVAGDLQAADLRPRTLDSAGGNPYALAAGPFLWFYGFTCLAIVASCVLSMARRSRRAGQGRGLGTRDTDPFTLALMAGGPQRALLTALTQLVDLGHATVSKAGTVRPMDPPDSRVHGLVRAVDAELRHTGEVSGDALFRSLRGRLQPALRRLRGGAEQQGLVLKRVELPTAEVHAVWLLPAAIALPRIVAALPAERPVGFLVMTLVATLAVGLIAVNAARTELTEGGRRLHERARQQSRALKARRESLVGDELLFGAAVLGGTFLTGTALADVRQALPQSTGGTGSSDGGDSGCGGGGCGGCGG